MILFTLTGVFGIAMVVYGLRTGAMTESFSDKVDWRQRHMKIYAGLLVCVIATGVLGVLAGAWSALSEPNPPSLPPTPKELSVALKDADVQLKKTIESTERLQKSLDQLAASTKDNLKTALEHDPVGTGSFSLCYVSARKDDVLNLLQKHWSDHGIAKRVEHRGTDDVTIWSGLDESYAKEYQKILDSMKIKSWVEGPAGASGSTQ